MGAHVDGFIAVVAHTVIVGGSKANGRKADALLAAHYASEAALRLVKPGQEVRSIYLNFYAFVAHHLAENGQFNNNSSKKNRRLLMFFFFTSISDVYCD